jgi:hypothetical protein
MLQLSPPDISNSKRNVRALAVLVRKRWHQAIGKKKYYDNVFLHLQPLNQMLQVPGCVTFASGNKLVLATDSACCVSTEKGGTEK